MSFRPALARRAGLTPLLAAGLVTFLPAGAQATSSPQPEGPCPDESGVTVVVDFTDLGGEVEVGCASAGGTGTEALQEAGFTDTRDDAGLICAIDSQPDPCPTTFEGVYWSYWQAEPGGEWEFAQEGSDTTVPEAGQVEGWRYYDGSEGPTVEPPVPGETVGGAAASGAAAGTEGEAGTEQEADATEAPAEGEVTAGGAQDGADAAEQPSTDDQTGADETGGTGLVWLIVGAAALLAVALTAAASARSRRSAQEHDGPEGPAGPR